MAENVYSEQFGPELTAEGLVEPILYYGDNLEILRRYIEDESVDLVHLDPPFKSDQDYNILFAERNDSHPAAQINPDIAGACPAKPCRLGRSGELAEGATQKTQS